MEERGEGSRRGKEGEGKKQREEGGGGRGNNVLEVYIWVLD